MRIGAAGMVKEPGMVAAAVMREVCLYLRGEVEGEEEEEEEERRWWRWRQPDRVKEN
jgi:hypothetical protein